MMGREKGGKEGETDRACAEKEGQKKEKKKNTLLSNRTRILRETGKTQHFSPFSSSLFYAVEMCCFSLPPSSFLPIHRSLFGPKYGFSAVPFLSPLPFPHHTSSSLREDGEKNCPSPPPVPSKKSLWKCVGWLGRPKRRKRGKKDFFLFSFGPPPPSKVIKVFLHPTLEKGQGRGVRRGRRKNLGGGWEGQRNFVLFFFCVGKERSFECIERGGGRLEGEERRREKQVSPLPD